MAVHDPTGDPIIDVVGLEKRFVVRRRAGRVRRRREVVSAVAGIDLKIERGAMVGYIGPNGAGKSTTIKMLTGILVPSAGTVRVDGLEPSRERTVLAARIGVVFGQRSQLWWDLPLRDSFELLRHVYRVPTSRHAANLARFTAGLDLGPLLDVPVRQLSLGQRMRGELTAALLHDPSILLLDEPTIGLDVVSKEAVREFLLALNREQGTTVLLTTHDLSDVERLCDRLLIIDHGRLIEDGTVGGITERYGTERTLVVDLAEPGPALRVEGAEVVRVEGPRQWLRFSRHDVTASELLTRVTATVEVRDLSVEEPDIESIVREIYGRSPETPSR
jgi:ABC-2 type transport system ATP-binding protein